MSNSPIAPALTTQVSVRDLIADLGVPQLASASECSMLRYPLQDGIDLLLWRGNFSRRVALQLHDDMGRINVSCTLQGKSSLKMANASNASEFVLTQGENCITHTPDCRAVSSYLGRYESLTLSFQPEAFRRWVPEVELDLQRKMGSQRCILQRPCSAEMHATARMMGDTLTRSCEEGVQPSSLWLQGQSMVFLSLVLDAHQEQTPPATWLSQSDRQKLLRAKDLLLSDLTQAPTITALSRETGLSVLKIKRGFRLLFNHSVYGLFQTERMQEARRRLMTGSMPVMRVATDLGYSNASHFTAAFYKQFGVNPSTFKRRL